MKSSNLESYGVASSVIRKQVRLADGVHRVRLDHGTTSGKRVITVDDKEVILSKLHPVHFSLTNTIYPVSLFCLMYLAEYLAMSCLIWWDYRLFFFSSIVATGRFRWLGLKTL